MNALQMASLPCSPRLRDVPVHRTACSLRTTRERQAHELGNVSELEHAQPHIVGVALLQIELPAAEAEQYLQRRKGHVEVEGVSIDGPAAGALVVRHESAPVDVPGDVRAD